MSQGKKKTKGKKAAFDVDAYPATAAPVIQSASVLSVNKHPNADKLKVCEISTGDAKYQVQLLRSFKPYDFIPACHGISMQPCKLRVWTDPKDSLLDGPAEAK